MDSDLKSDDEAPPASDAQSAFTPPAVVEPRDDTDPQPAHDPALLAHSPGTPLPAQEQPETTPPAADEPPPAADPRPLLAILARTRTIEILVALGDSDTPTRYRTLAARLGTTMLSIRLRELTTAGLVDRHVEPGPPIETSYALTPTAAPLLPPLRDILTWAATHTLAGQTPAPPAPAADEPLPAD
ncbi:DNA-binding transcriptional regulator, HxlR family [Parafrankia irregularis]|uniref:DNA-binding transcriptional regulator, HxlR family n=1 Tax=Parafrankia irregularis TaxID=795642 RepID=A0A0S4QZA7_9ACTN|nr:MULTISPECIES: helix-turn-helix domain-containing protein [Parafrankia]MBE3206721.1 helix-turn-helix transcriptional regulator [Parafrankia sp. CH37]CUU60977.1 DNA-binding transcriptional regulator, HxlR family [Parafrankia irregularis]